MLALLARELAQPASEDEPINADLRILRDRARCLFAKSCASLPIIAPEMSGPFVHEAVSADIPGGSGQGSG